METLSNKFNVLINQYQDTYKDFLNVIDSSNNNLTTIENSAFIGENNINTIQNSSVNNCISSCNESSSCSGATFNNQLNTCTLTSGSGTVLDSTKETAIVRQALYYTNQLQNLNKELLSINEQMTEISNQNYNNYNNNSQNIEKKSEILNKNYAILQEESQQIDELVNQYSRLNSEIQNSNIIVTSNYYKYIVFFIIALFLIFLLIRVSNVTPIGQYGGSGHLNLDMKLILMYLLLGFIIVFNSYIKK